MSFQVAGHQTQGYLVNTPVFEGPLDLLLQLIEKSELDITRLALAQVTDQYLAYLKLLSDRTAAEVSAFLIIAAKLIQIKSEALLPRPPVRQPGEDDPAEALAQQLILYKQYKQIAGWLLEKEAAGSKTYLRLAPPPRVEGKLDMSGVSLSDLIFAAHHIFIKEQILPALSQVVSIPLLTIRDRIKSILVTIKKQKHSSFQQILEGRDHSKIEIVVTFLAMLELIKRRMIEANQESLFSDIQFHAIGDWDESIEFDLELGE
jgi:segregation and condensation protein A